MTIQQRPGQKVFTVPGPEWGVRVIEPGFQVAAGNWYDGGGTIGCCVGAYQARGAANYAASLVNLPQPGVNNLTEFGGGPPGWNAIQGWFNFRALNRALSTGWVPGSTQNWSMYCRYANSVVINTTIAGSGIGAPLHQFQVNSNNFPGAVIYANGGNRTVAPALLTGSLGVAGNQGYRDGLPDGPVINPAAGVNVNDVYIGAANLAGWLGVIGFTDADVYLLSLYNCVLNAADMAAVEAMAILI